MRIAFLKEDRRLETRIAALPSTLEKLTALGAEIWIEAGFGETLNISDAAYEKIGAKISDDRATLLKTSDLIVKVQKPDIKDIPLIKENAIHISFLYPFTEQSTLASLAKHHVSTISMDMIPRTTLAQKMDAISSQSNISGYAAVILGSQHLLQILPMMVTPSGTITPARVFVIGAGVAGLQAIATAKRLGARVEAFDTRAAAQEQIKSLGAKCIKVNIGKTDETKYGYAKALTDTQLQQQQDAMSAACEQADLVISTAKVFGKPAPLLINNAVLKRMKKGSVVVDMAVDTGGNVEGSQLNEIIEINHVKIIGTSPLCQLFPLTASQMYANNILNFITQFWDNASKRFILKTDDEIIKNSLLTHNGKILQDF
jgi:NAD(P) transhydrogenase subunit alpha